LAGRLLVLKSEGAYSLRHALLLQLPSKFLMLTDRIDYICSLKKTRSLVKKVQTNCWMTLR